MIKKFFYSTSIFLATFSTSLSSFAGGDESLPGKQNFVKVMEAVRLEKQKPLQIDVSKPINTMANSKLCFLLDEIHGASVEPSDIGAVLAEKFRDTSEDYRDIRSVPPKFIDGKVTDGKGHTHALYGDRQIVTEWAFTEEGFVHFIYACSAFMNNPKTIQSIEVTAHSSFSCNGVFVFNRN